MSKFQDIKRESHWIQENARLQEEVAALKSENERLEKQVARLLEPVSDEEQAELGIKAFVNGASIRYELFPRKNVESLIAKRLGPICSPTTGKSQSKPAGLCSIPRGEE